MSTLAARHRDGAERGRPRCAAFHGNAAAAGAAAHAYVPTQALAKRVAFAREMMHVHLEDGRIIGVPPAWFPRLDSASAGQRQHYEIGGGGVSIHWPDIDEDLSVANLLAGADWRAA